MTQFPPQVGPHGTRLVRFISDLALADMEPPHQDFAERLGRLIDFGDSMRLAALHDKLGKIQVEPSPSSGDALRDDILRLRMSLVQSVAASFVLDAGAKLRLPSLKTGVALDKLATFEPYHRFYAAHQREFESRINTLQLGIRDALSKTSTELARLAALDEAVRDTLTLHTRKSLALVPLLLGKRFAFLQQEHCAEGDGAASDEDELETWTRPDGWLGRFYKEMQGMLLAELELRLLPVLGLVEAVNEEAGGSR